MPLVPTTGSVSHPHSSLGVDALIAQATTGFEAEVLANALSPLFPETCPWDTHSMRRTKASLIYRRTKNLRAVQLLLEYRKIDGTVRYLGIEVDDALDLAEQTEG